MLSADIDWFLRGFVNGLLVAITVVRLGRMAKRRAAAKQSQRRTRKAPK